MTSYSLAAISLILSSYALLYCYKASKTGQLATPAALYAALVLLHLSIPGMLVGFDVAPSFVNPNNTPFAIEAIFFSTLGLIALQFGSAFGSGKFNILNRQTSNTQTCSQWKSTRIFFVTCALLAVGWCARAIVINEGRYFQIDRAALGGPDDFLYAAGPFFAAIMMSEQFPLYAFCIVSIRYWRQQANLPNLFRRMFLAIAATELLYWIPSGRKEPVILTLLLPLMIRYLLTKRLPSRFSMLAFVGFIALLIITATIYRVAMTSFGDRLDLIDIVLISVAEVLTSDNAAAGSSDEILFGRLSLLEPLSACIRLMEMGIWEPMLGTSYANAVISLFPRFLWPNKPHFHFGTDFGHAAGYLSGYTETSISVTFFGESFLNFGWGGIVPIFFIGLAFGVVYGLTRYSRHRETWLLLYASLLPVILYVGGTFALYFGGLLKTLPFLYVLGRIMAAPPKELNQIPSASKPSIERRN